MQLERKVAELELQLAPAAQQQQQHQQATTSADAVADDVGLQIIQQ